MLILYLLRQLGIWEVQVVAKKCYHTSFIVSDFNLYIWKCLKVWRQRHLQNSDNNRYFLNSWKLS